MREKFRNNYSTINYPSKMMTSSLLRQNHSTIQINHNNLTTIDRPQTSLLLTYTSKFTTKRNNFRMMDQMQMQTAEEDLERMFKGDLTAYLHRKFRNFVIKRHQIKTPQTNSYRTIHNPQSINGFCSKMKIVNQFQPQPSRKDGEEVGQMVQSPYIVNAKERIARLVELRKEEEDSFRKLNLQIKSKCRSKQLLLKRPSARPAMGSEKEIQWEEKWKQECSNELRRYKKRVARMSQEGGGERRRIL